MRKLHQKQVFSYSLFLLLALFVYLLGLTCPAFTERAYFILLPRKTRKNSVTCSFYRTKPGTDLMNPFSRTQEGWPVAGATQSVRPAAFAADRTSALTIQVTPSCCLGSPSISPNCTSQIPSLSKSENEFATRQTPSDSKATPLLRVTVCGVKFINIIT